MSSSDCVHAAISLFHCGSWPHCLKLVAYRRRWCGSCCSFAWGWILCSTLCLSFVASWSCRSRGRKVIPHSQWCCTSIDNTRALRWPDQKRYPDLHYECPSTFAQEVSVPVWLSLVFLCDHPKDLSARWRYPLNRWIVVRRWVLRCCGGWRRSSWRRQWPGTARLCRRITDRRNGIVWRIEGRHRK